MVYKTANGVEIVKTFTFKQGDYPIEVGYQVMNRSQQNWQGQFLVRLNVITQLIQVNQVKVSSS